ncbi:hypothetical protein P152DRAFT_505813 [Eremomyces bilateralis CBS 781.70]|uniref:TECPR1-like DysF domain-containing protein n=1 Tax=Eremomyces bilateralis CBS 781.70 TaxID=1392243 RepID=A0A6G1GAG5_9PEZI|nr:uncharacterized protein P152DRAFT_505813 [Eremomyces bilateralis CBS 781.70]KAF1814829.1 hypothetical protein P152DRAFT_505813 [Eremomyces bilateralis CBS 781.70]
MDDANPDYFVNRDEPIPVIHIDSLDGFPEGKAPDKQKSKRESLKDAISRERIRERLDNFQAKRSAASGGLQDRLFTTLLQHMIPTEDQQQDLPGDRRERKYVERPGFSLPLMSNNFRRFNARIGVAFVFQNRMIRLFTWRKPTHTLSFLAIYTFICINPYLLPVLPLALCLFFIMIPAFLARHPPPPAMLETDLYPLAGPPLAPPRRIRPAPELSKDFFRNMGDLQNCMEDFSRMHDLVLATFAPLTNFSNESLSSELFLLLMFTAAALCLIAHILPWRTLALLIGWSATCSGNKSLRRFLLAFSHHPAVSDLTSATKSNVAKLTDPDPDPDTRPFDFFTAHAAADIVLAEAPEQREVEVFELQRRDVIHSLSTTVDSSGGVPTPTHLASYDNAPFEPYIFSASPHTPLAPARIAGERPRGTRFFEDVQAPEGWEWGGKKWVLDLGSREWVEERCVTGVEVEVEGERWVWDILYDEEVGGEREEGEWGTKDRGKGKGKGKVVSWEEGNGMGRRGEWRRRRWVRTVKRRVVVEKDTRPASKL